MTMKILIVEDEPSLSSFYKETFRRQMPEARVDIVVSVGGYLNVSETRYDAYLMDENISGGESAFEHIVPKILARFPGAFVLHNGSDSDPDNISHQERIHKIRFSRGPDGRVITCAKQIGVAIEAIRSMVVPRDEVRKELPARERMPVCQSIRAHPEPRMFLKCCRP